VITNATELSSARLSPWSLRQPSALSELASPELASVNLLGCVYGMGKWERDLGSDLNSSGTEFQWNGFASARQKKIPPEPKP
jgi:hypothetical protein